MPLSDGGATTNGHLPTSLERMRRPCINVQTGGKVASVYESLEIQLVAPAAYGACAIDQQDGLRRVARNIIDPEVESAESGIWNGGI